MKSKAVLEFNDVKTIASVGRYLAKDLGATLQMSRSFKNVPVVSQVWPPSSVSWPAHTFPSNRTAVQSIYCPHSLALNRTQA